RGEVSRLARCESRCRYVALRGRGEALPRRAARLSAALAPGRSMSRDTREDGLARRGAADEPSRALGARRRPRRRLPRSDANRRTRGRFTRRSTPSAPRRGGGDRATRGERSDAARAGVVTIERDTRGDGKGGGALRP